VSVRISLLPLVLLVAWSWPPPSRAANDGMEVDVSAELSAGSAAFNRGDVIAAMNHYRVAAEAGSDEAKNRLAWILDQSEENERAVALYRESAVSGSASGQYGLAEMYAKGEGVPRDLRAAARYFTMAANAGHTGAMRVLAAAYDEGTLGLVPDPDEAAYWRQRLAEAESLQQPHGKQEQK